MQGAWSYSSLSTFETCGRKYYHLKVAKDVVDPPNEHSTWGGRVHNALEEYVKFDTPLPPEMDKYRGTVDIFKNLARARYTERKLAVDVNLDPCDFDSTEAWYRGIIDLCVVGNKDAIAIDYKTGKVKHDHDQLTLFACLLFAHHPTIEAVRTGYLWLKTDEVTSKTFHRDDLDKMWMPFMQRAGVLEHAYANNKWTPRPSGLCRGWCPVKTCEYYERVR
jgi:PD-(D/E)XK nuclease superfamily